MSEERPQCEAMTKAGTRCKNRAAEDSIYCHVHQSEASMTAAMDSPPQPVTESSPTYRGEEKKQRKLPEESRVEFAKIADELRALSAQLQQESRYTPPSFSVEALATLIQQNIYRFTPAAQREIIETLRSNVRGTKPQDLVDPETWKGFWYVLNYMAQHQRQEAAHKVSQQLEKVPGFAMLSELSEGLREADPKDFLDPDTWKGLYYVVNHMTRLQITQIKNRILGHHAKGSDENL